MVTARYGQLSLCAAAVLATAAAHATEPYAVRIDAENAARLVMGGTDAIGGIGDWALGNGKLCAIVSDSTRETDATTTGGALVDLGFCGRADDQFVRYQEFLSTPDTKVRVERVDASVEPGRAYITTRSAQDGVSVETRYELDGEEARRLRIETRVERSEGAPRVFAVGGISVNGRGLTPFSLSTDGRGRGHGFVHHHATGATAIVTAAEAVDLVVSLGSVGLEPEIAYGHLLVSARLERASGTSVEVPHFFAASSLATVPIAFARPFWIGASDSLSLIKLLQTQLMNVAPGDRLVMEQEVWVGDRADPASVTDLVFAGEPLLQGRVDGAPALVHIDREAGEPLTAVAVADDGHFAVRVPPGRYHLRVRAAGGREWQRDVEHSADGTDAGTLALPPAARVRLPRGGPMRLVFIGVDDTPDPRFRPNLRGYRMFLDGEDIWVDPQPIREVHLAGADRDPSVVTIAPGRYRVLATLGPEYSVTEARLEVEAGQVVDLDIAPPERVVETPGWISADFHVHAAASMDTGLAPDARVVSFVAQGAEVLVSSDHDNVWDYAPVIAELGLGDRVASLVGVEITSELGTERLPYTIGHANAYPMPRDPHAHQRGAVANEDRRWREILAELRALPGERVVQLNHPWADGVSNGAFLSHMGVAGVPYDPNRPLSEPPNRVLIEPDPRTGVRDLDFDAIELMNGPYSPMYLAMRERWLSFLLQGERLTAVMDSDSHFLRFVALPRSYVRVPDDSISGLDTAAFVRAVREGRVWATTGPLLPEVTLGDAGIGDTFTGHEGTLRVRVEAAEWVPVDELRVRVNAEVRHREPISPPASAKVPLHFESDSLVVVEVWGEPTGGVYAEVASSDASFAFANPIYVDADGDGVWTPPGLPPRAEEGHGPP